MDQPRWIPQLYGYTVCLVAVITILISVTSLVNNVFEYAAPEMSHEVTNEFAGQSLEGCKQRYMMRTAGATRPGGPAAPSAQLPADSILMRLCAEERAERIGIVRYRAMRSLVTSSFMLLLALGLFGLHWRWLRTSRTTMA